MSNMRFQVTVPKQLGEHAKNLVAAGLFSTTSEYVTHLMRLDQNAAVEKLNAMIQEGIDSGPAGQTPKQVYAEVKKDIRKVSARSKINK